MVDVPLPVLILASMSPRRQELLRRLGLSFTVKPAHVDEEGLEAAFTGPREALAVHLAQQKAQTIAATLPMTQPPPIIAADTTVLLNGMILGKPSDADDARRILRLLRNRTHQVHTGLVVLASANAQFLSQTVMTPVTMRDYSDEEIERYIATGDPFDKAGSYAIQHPTFQPVARIAGCATNVIGLPLCVLVRMLRSTGITLPSSTTSVTACPWDARCAASAYQA